MPSLSPDGKKIVFSSAVGGGVQKIYTINVDGTGLVSIFTESASMVGVSAVHFTPEGKIMFENVSTLTVWIMNDDGSNAVPLINAPSNTAMYSLDGHMSTLYYSDGTATYVEDVATGKVTATLTGYFLLGVLPNDGGILLTDYNNVYTESADGTETPAVLSSGSWGSAN
jgi:DNA-binding beta-propeller fold protein YncE